MSHKDMENIRVSPNCCGRNTLEGVAMDNNNKKHKPVQNRMEERSHNGGLANIVTVVISVVIILIVIWYLANKIIDVTGSGQGGGADIPVFETTAEESQEETTEELDSEESLSEEVEVSESSEAEESSRIPEQLTQGTADRYEPDTWIGKTFEAIDGANVRSGPGTDYGIIEGVSPGERVTVIDAEYVGDATWINVIFTADSGEEAEGWIYNFAISNEPVE